MLINGPINAIRLEGIVNNVKKIIYLYMDYHMFLQEQTECESYESINIDKYLYDLFKKTNQTIDFFFEIKHTQATNNTIPLFKGMYIQTVQKLYKKAKLDTSTKQNIKNNVRFHYLDIRDHLEKNIYYFSDLLDSNVKSLRTNKIINSNNFNNILEACRGLIYDLEIYQYFFKDNINKKLSRTKNINSKKEFKTQDMIFYFLNKITKKYKNKDIINKIKKDYFGDILNQINICIDRLKELSKIVLSKEDYVYRLYEQKIQFKENNNDPFLNLYTPPDFDDFIFACDKLNDEIQEKIRDIFLKITDLFFLRRFLDKDYITKAIVYTGGAHSVNYINVLTSFFDFKITHFSHSDERDLEKLNKIAKENPSKLFYVLNPPELVQCSDLSGFPNDFD